MAHGISDDTLVGERGVTLSGGQRQRIAIARALVKDAPILIMDEPTSAVDLESEGLIMDALTHLMQKCTVILITHRPSLIKLANRVVMLTDGVIKEVGTDERLRADGGFQDLLDGAGSATP